MQDARKVNVKDFSNTVPTVIHSIEIWRDELDLIDAELIFLLRRRMQLAIQLLAVLRNSDLTLGKLHHDIDRLGIFLYAEIGEPILAPLDRHSLEQIFRRIIIEEKRLAGSPGEGDKPQVDSRSKDAKG